MANNQLKTNEQFILDCLKKYPEGLFDYSSVEYAGARVKVTIICKKHGPFSIIPNSFLTKNDCPKCGFERKQKSCALPVEEFIARATKKHQGLYTYENVEYINLNTKAFVTCRLHGDWLVSPRSHMRGVGCPLCIKEKRSKSEKARKRKSYTPVVKLTDEERLSKLLTTLNLPENISLSNYRGGRHATVDVWCEDHGSSVKEVSSIIRGHPCTKCVFPLRYGDTFLAAAEAKFEGRYRYIYEKYPGPFGNIDIICPDHGKFSQQVRSHLYSNTGCPACAKGGFKANLAGVLYVLICEEYLKVGITNNFKRRLKEINRSSYLKFSPLRLYYSEFGKVVAEAETEILKTLTETLMPCQIEVEGKTEVFIYKNLFETLNFINNVFTAKERAMFEKDCE